VNSFFVLSDAYRLCNRLVKIVVTGKTLAVFDATKQITRDRNQRFCEKVTGIGRLRSETARLGEIAARLDEWEPDCVVGPEPGRHASKAGNTWSIEKRQLIILQP
jgi:hypothetical protein